MENHKNEKEMYFQPSSSLSSDLLNMFYSQELSDAIITCKGTPFRVHKTILFARCRKLYDAIQSGDVAIDCVSPETMFAILEFIYGEKIPSHFSAETIFSAIELCSKLELYDLIRHLELSLEEHLSEKSLFQVLETSEELNLRTIHLACLLLVKLHSKSVVNSSRLVHCPPDMIVEIAEQIFPSK